MVHGARIALNRTIELWRSVDFPYHWEHDVNLFTGVNASDSTCAELDGRFWLFTCMAAKGEQAYRDLFVFHATNPRGPWIAHRKNPVVSDLRWGRPAGKLFRRDGLLLRPAQDCATIYGRQMTVRAIRELTPDDYAEQELYAIEPDWTAGLLATHTLNMVERPDGDRRVSAAGEVLVGHRMRRQTARSRSAGLHGGCSLGTARAISPPPEVYPTSPRRPAARARR